MPSLSQVMSNAAATWGDQVDKGSLRGVPFWIHGVRASSYVDLSNPKQDGPEGRTIELLVCDITLHNPSRKAQHAVITLGMSTEREGLLAYFIDNTEPIGPVHTFEVPLKGGRSFWRLEDYDEEIVNAQLAQFNADGLWEAPALTGGK